MVPRFLRRVVSVALLGLWAGYPGLAVAQTATAMPDDLSAYVRDLGKQMTDDRPAALRSVNQVARNLLALEVTGEDLLYAGLILVEGRQHDAALKRFNAYLAGSPASREQGLAGVIAAASFKEENCELAKAAYENYLQTYGSSRTEDLLRPGVPLILRVEQSMAQALALSKGDPIRHYERALEALKKAEPGRVAVQDVFNLRWYYADALAGSERLDEAIQYLIDTRPVVQSDPKTALQLEDRILFKQTARLVEQGKHEEARVMLERRLPEMTGDEIVHRRVSKLLDRVKLINAAAPELVPGVWIGSEPLTLAGLKGKVVVLEFFTSG